MKKIAAARTVLITGASRGIGAAIAERYRKAGWYTLTPSRSELDLADPVKFAQQLKQYQKEQVDVLINNAAENVIDPLSKIQKETWSRMIQSNLTAPMELMQVFGKTMSEKGWGRIVNVGSVFSFVSRPGRLAYTTTKTGLLGMTRAAALELASQGVLVNLVSPGYVATEMTSQNNSREEIAALVSQIPLQRLGQPEEIAELVYFLGSEKNSYITGAAIPIDGGFLCQ